MRSQVEKVGSDSGFSATWILARRAQKGESAPYFSCRKAGKKRRLRGLCAALLTGHAGSPPHAPRAVSSRGNPGGATRRGRGESRVRFEFLRNLNLGETGSESRV